MDFSRLPDPAFLKIIEYLPLEDRIRVGRVDKTFRRIAQLATSRTKSLDLDTYHYRNLSPDQLAVILDLCSTKLERIKFGCAFRSSMAISRERHRAITLANYECPRLIEINLGHTYIDYAVFDQLIRNNQNLESLVWKTELIGYPPVTNTNLNKLTSLVSNDDAIRSIIGRFPNLKELDLRMGPAIINANILDQFFASIPQVDRVNLEIIKGDYGQFAHMFYEICNELVNFWNLPLTSLSIRLPVLSDVDILHKLATSFKRLKKLHLDNLVSTNPINAGIEALANLQDMEILELEDFVCGQDQLEQGIRHLARCKKLQKLSMKANISGGTLVNLLRSCPQLEHVAIRGISQVDNPEEAAVVLDSLVGIAQRHITLELCFWNAAVIWDAGPVKEVIGKLEENDGLKIKVRFARS